MEHIKAIQSRKNLRQICARDFIEQLEKILAEQNKNIPHRLGSIFLMPKTFLGSTPYYMEKYADLMTIVRNLGNPTWYI